MVLYLVSIIERDWPEMCTLLCNTLFESAYLLICKLKFERIKENKINTSLQLKYITLLEFSKKPLKIYKNVYIGKQLHNQATWHIHRTDLILHLDRSCVR